MTEINENESDVNINDIDACDGINTDTGNSAGDIDADGGISNDSINTDTDNGTGDIDANYGVNTEIGHDMSEDDINGGISNDGVCTDTDGTNTDISNDIREDDVNYGVNTEIGNDASEDESLVDETRILEALLFASDELLTPSRLKAILPGSPDVRHIRKLVGEINERLLTEGHPFEVVEAAGGYQFRTLAAYHPYVRKLYKERAAKKLSVPALECLAIIAYRQPITKAEVEGIRGVLSDGAMKTLFERKLIDLCGRSDKPGRPMLYGTTGDFLRYFGINKLGDLPRIEEFEQMARAKMEELSAEELNGEKEVGVEDGGAVETAPADA